MAEVALETNSVGERIVLQNLRFMSVDREIHLVDKYLLE